MAPTVDDRSEERPVTRTIGRGRLLAGAIGAGVASLFGRTTGASAQDDVPQLKPLLLEVDNVAEGTSSLLASAAGPTLEVGSSLLPRQAVITDTLSAVALAGFSPSIGVLGFSSPITQTVPFHLPISRSGVAGIGPRSGVEGRSLLPQGPQISISAVLARGVTGISDGLGVLGLSRQASISLTDETLFRAGAAGLGDQLGVWGSAGSNLTATTELTQTVGVLGTVDGPDARAIVARNPSGIALEVVGVAAFKGGGRGVIRPRSKSASVEDASISPDSLVNVTLAGDPGNAATVQYARVGEGLLEVFLTVPVRLETPFSYFVYRHC